MTVAHKRATAPGVEPDSAETRRDRVLESAARLPTPPDIVMQLIGMMDDDEAGAEEIAQLVERDLALTARVLKVSNSSYYGMTGQIGTVRDAVVILGFSNVCNLVIATEMANRYATPLGQRAALAGFWRHGVLTAFCASAIGRRCGAEDGFAFTGGLLHDIGELAIASTYPDEFRELVSAGGTAPDPLALERERFGMDHATLGGWITERWRFPTTITSALSGHHDAGSQHLLARVIGHADRIGHALTATDAAAATALQAVADALVALDVRESAPELLAEIEGKADAASSLFPAQA